MRLPHAPGLIAAATVLAILAVLVPQPAPSEAKGSSTIISGGDLPHPITMPFEDASALSYAYSSTITWDQFRGWPTSLHQPPAVLGRGYEVDSDLWGEVLYRLGLGLQQGSPQWFTATYYPEQQAAHVHVEPDELDVWLHLDADRAALLNRYIALGRAGLLPEEPSILDVFVAEYKLTDSLAPVIVDDRALESQELASFWAVVESGRWPEIVITMSRAGAKPYAGNSTASGDRFEAMVYGYPEPTRLIFTSPDGRHIELQYYPVTSVLAGMPTNWCCIPSGRGIAVPPAIADSFAAALGVSRVPVEVATDDAGSGVAPSELDRAALPLAGAAMLVVLAASAVLATATAIARAEGAARA